jgi:hypothetical protein
VPKSKSSDAALREWLCSGTPPDPAPELIPAARAQGLTALLAAEIDARPGSWSPALMAMLRRESYSLLVDGVRKLDTGARALSVLGKRGLRALPLKGAALAETLYLSVAERPMVDVDLIVLHAFPEAVEALEESGFAVQERADHAWALEDSETKVTVELHRSLTSCAGFFPIDGPGLWSRSREAPGQISRTPSPEDLLVHLALHASFQHGLVLSLVQWLDFRRLLERGVSHERLLSCAAAARAQTALAVALKAAASVVGARVSPDVEEALGPFLPRGLRMWLAERRPLSFVRPEVPHVARLRWGLAEGRRFELVRRTLQGGETRSAVGQIRRAGALLARFGPELLS